MTAAPKKIGDVLPGVLGQVKERHGALMEITRRWGGLVGKALAAHTRPMSLVKGRLMVQADRPGDSFALSYQRVILLKRLQDALPGKIEEMIVRPGGTGPAGRARKPPRPGR